MLVCSLSLLVLLASCQDGSSPSKKEEPGSPAPRPQAIEVRDDKGAVTASIARDRPCRAYVDGVELLVGLQPLVATVGAVTWTGATDEGGTLIRRDDEPVARVTPGTDTFGVYDARGVGVIRAALEQDTAKVISVSGAVLRVATRTGSGIAVGDRTVTGTDDLLLAAVLAAPEARPEVRALAACLRANPGDRAL